ncbi:MAG TPA: integrin alpha, partial [Planctomycetota bacterium]|nr:integrin alpha [Planctomycetota bacterium]
RVEVRSGANGSLLFSLSGATAGSGYGASVAGTGDVNGDGVSELAVGVPCASPGGLAGAGQASLSSVVGIPPGSSLFGAGCPGSSGVAPLLQTAGGDPSASTGNPGFSIVLSRAVPSAPALLLVGVSNAFWAAAGIALPANLAPIGFPACSLDVSIEVLFPATTSAGGLEFVSLAVPANAGLAGQAVYLQAFVLDPPGAMTQGLQLVL